ncbi:MAG TPA: AAA family ATPase [Candidatus Saccharimonadales bacterium]|nr:AAA family ATPase [Candidatus Saccharimonadales bacterium]
MSHHPNLIHLNGPASIGKNTIAQKYIDEHPFALLVSTDDIITTLGQWSVRENYDPARHLAFQLALSMISTHLEAGYDVIVPHLLTDLEEAQAFETVAQAQSAAFIEILLHTDKTDAIDRVFERGTRGEPGAPPLTEDDRDEFEELYDNVQKAASHRPNIFTVTSSKGDVKRTYQQVLKIISEADKH